MSNKSGLSFDLSPEQLEKLGPLIETTGKLKIAGTIEGNSLNVSFLACNAAFIACNAAFKIEAQREI
ncbi:hypothetical protein [Bacillus cereus]|uniref:hypothetical protein n=1 Tax=Bacillus cereus TaxID=1396 RepID=UPI001374DF5B|nr:hypothetical protein [Bacillus cereus]